MFNALDEILFSGEESLNQLLLLLKSCSPLIINNRKVVRDSIPLVEECLVLMSNISQRVRSICSKSLISKKHVQEANGYLASIDKILKNLHHCAETCAENKVLDQAIFASTINIIKCASAKFRRFNEISHAESHTDEATVVFESCLSSISKLVESTLLGVQAVVKKSREETVNESMDFENTNIDIDTSKLWEIHKMMANEWSDLQIDKIKEAIENVISSIQLYSNDSKSSLDRFILCSRLSNKSCALLLPLLDLCRERLNDMIQFYKCTGKLLYVLLRIFRNLVAKGYCADEVEDGEGDGEGDISGMKFEDDVEGTGMGEGDGNNDVTDQIENEEQLLGLENDEQPSDDKNKQELDEEEAEKGMEMEGT